MKNAYVDTNVVLDLLLNRVPFSNEAAILFSKANLGLVKLYVSALTVAYSHYHITKQHSKAVATSDLSNFMPLVTMLSLNESVIKKAITSNFKDFEDAIQYFTCIENNLSYIITRNIKDFKNSTISVLTPQEYLKLI